MAILRGFSRARDARGRAALRIDGRNPSDAAVARVFLFGADRLSRSSRSAERGPTRTIELRFAAGADPVVYVLDPMRQQVTSAVAVDVVWSVRPRRP
jgi:hypothetical protein